MVHIYSLKKQQQKKMSNFLKQLDTVLNNRKQSVYER